MKDLKVCKLSISKYFYYIIDNSPWLFLMGVVVLFLLSSLGFWINTIQYNACLIFILLFFLWCKIIDNCLIYWMWLALYYSMMNVLAMLFMNTVLLIVSMVMMTWAHKGIIENKGMEVMLFFSFMSYVLMGLHDLHVTMGFILLFFCLCSLVLKYFSIDQHLGFVFVMMYQYFVDMNWIYIRMCLSDWYPSFIMWYLIYKLNIMYLIYKLNIMYLKKFKLLINLNLNIKKVYLKKECKKCCFSFVYKMWDLVIM